MMVNKRTWDEFRETGLLWFVNTILHVFGWSIVFDYDNKVIKNVYPARVKFRGFSEEINDNGYKNVAKYLKNNIDNILEESFDE